MSNISDKLKMLLKMNEEYYPTVKSESKSDNCRLSLTISFVLGALIGCIAFVAIYGVEILNVCNDEWLLYSSNMDLMQHYVGWKLFRASDWHFPVGLADNSFYPYLQSVIYTDSIPIVSIIFKLLSPVLPETFQFFGIYGIFCFAMQGGVAKLLLRKVIKEEWLCNIACIPFIIACPMIQRMYYHTALASQYLILLAILPWLYSKELRSFPRKLTYYVILGIVTVSVHFTLYGIISVVFFGFVIFDCIEIRYNIKQMLVKMIKYIVIYIAFSLLTLYLLGAFVGNIDNIAGGLGIYSANLNALVNSQFTSNYFDGLEYFVDQYEGLAYIGVSGLLLTLAAIPVLIYNRKTIWKNNKFQIIPFLVTYVLLWEIALSPSISFGGNVIAITLWPGFVLDAWSMFRSSGRFMWPVMYASILIPMYYSRALLKRVFPVFLIICVGLQCFEYTNWIEERQESILSQKGRGYSANELYDCGIDISKYKHIQLMDELDFDDYYGDKIARNILIGYGSFAADNDMTISNYHFSRENTENLKNQISLCESELQSGNASEDTIYVFRRDEFEKSDKAESYKNLIYEYTDTEVLAFRK